MTEDANGESADTGQGATSAARAGHEATDATGTVAGGGSSEDARDARPTERAASPKGGRPKRRELALPDGHRLVLNPDRTIVHRDAGGGVVASWAPEDPDWARHALRFGLRPVEPTANPHDRHIRSSKPPGW